MVNDHGVEMKNHSWSNTVINTADDDLSWSAVFDHDIMVFISTGIVTVWVPHIYMQYNI